MGGTVDVQDNVKLINTKYENRPISFYKFYY
jgi:hypothetical protein